MAAGALRLAQFGLGAVATVTAMQKVLADVAALRQGWPATPGPGPLREAMNPNQARTAA